MFAEELSDFVEALLFPCAAQLLSFWVVGEDTSIPELLAAVACGFRGALSCAHPVADTCLDSVRDFLADGLD